MPRSALVACLALGACARFPLVSLVDGGAPGDDLAPCAWCGADAAPVACGPATCDGCCDGPTCVARAAVTDARCGSGGEACEACPPGAFCKGGCFQRMDACGPANCAGCCEGDFCATGVHNGACGHGGQLCQLCGDGAQCEPWRGGGGACGGVQMCTPYNCGGCCDGPVCRPGATASQCGSNGDPCHACAADEACVAVFPRGGECEAPPFCTGCRGCCRGNTCMPGTADGACGGDGSACQDCTAFGASCSGITANRPVCAPGPH